MDINRSPYCSIGMILFSSVAVWPLARAKHQRNAGAVDVAIAQAHPHTGLLQRHRQIRRDSRFADANPCRSPQR